ncbi:transporter [Candidatus Gottesmanbacteria bacterium RIFCSPHIGHO2_01_FULL_39_10]|uniref:Probable queuosine precursor transporter n=1 Tax=Candidatus Gottesmanbacteria bacterium RIFCSPHIGHO2_01_FULL_39_10 TaxID=1798375 RepID=A0A1F5ZKH3_9BACT|nr:MAG: transporter [Candidatus Gottesmanbacteria bacterium RIFCSPHIGHO2_01_FULL_39_10]
MNYQKYPTAISPLFVTIAALFVCFLMISNIIVNRLFTFAGLIFPGDFFLFPLTYIFGDILTEVYGFKRSRLVIWLGFLANIIMAIYFSFILSLPKPSELTNSDAFNQVLGSTPRIVIASLIAYFFGEFTNSAVISMLKKRTVGKYLWMRTIGSTLVGQVVDTGLFSLIAFTYLPFPALIQIMVLSYIYKVGYEILATPLTYAIVAKVKQIEKVDTFDYGISYNPVALDIEYKKGSKDQ